MSLYNMAYGMRPEAFLLLPILGRHPGKYPRFRDCYLGETNDHLHILTRMGSRNREMAMLDDTIAEGLHFMETHPLYLPPWLDSRVDPTYALHVFKIPDEFLPDVAKFRARDFQNLSAQLQELVLETFPRVRGSLEKLFFRP